MARFLGLRMQDFSWFLFKNLASNVGFITGKPPIKVSPCYSASPISFANRTVPVVSSVINKSHSIRHVSFLLYYNNASLLVFYLF